MRLALAALMLAAAPAAAHEVKKGEITVEHPLMRASLGRSPNSAGYFVVRNSGKGADRLLGASCACAARVEMHAHTMSDGVASMRPVASVVAPAGGSAVFAPQGHHLMIVGLKKPLEAGTMANVTLRFERAGAVTVPFFVTARVEEELNAHRKDGHAQHAH
jgi:hypothetical protein